MHDGSPLRRDPKSIRTLAKHAVKDVYQFSPSYKRKEVHGYRQFLMETRDAIAAQFRQQYGSSVVVNGVERANVFPCFIGVFDTVAALGHKYLGPGTLRAWHSAPDRSAPAWRRAGAHLPLDRMGRVDAELPRRQRRSTRRSDDYLKIAPPLPGYGFFKRLKTLHFAPPKQKFYDTTLNPNVGYAKHAISIDENRADFKRVGWSPTAEKQDERDDQGNLYFDQVQSLQLTLGCWLPAPRWLA
jgi:hypothetical protein